LEALCDRIISFLALAVVSLLATACSEDPSNPSGLERFDATLTVTAWVEAPGGRCPGLTGTVTGSGQATPGGPFTIEASHCLDTTHLPVDSFISLTDGQFAFDFASGATLTGTHTGNLFLEETGLYSPQADFLFTGGTGDFAHPSGSASFVQFVDSASSMLDRQTGQATKLWLTGLIVP
jgi:hypothetical protein